MEILKKTYTAKGSYKKEKSNIEQTLQHQRTRLENKGPCICVNYLFILFFDIVNHMLWLPEENLQDSPNHKNKLDL